MMKLSIKILILLICLIIAGIIIYLFQLDKSINILSTSRLNNSESIALIEDIRNNSKLEIIDTESGKKIRSLLKAPKNTKISKYILSASKDKIAYLITRITDKPIQDTNQKLFILDIKSKKEELLKEKINTPISFSFDYSSNNLAITTPINLEILNIDTKKTETIFEYKEVYSSAADAQYLPEPFWSKDNKSIKIIVRDEAYNENMRLLTYEINTETKEKKLINQGIEFNEEEFTE